MQADRFVVCGALRDFASELVIKHGVDPARVGHAVGQFMTDAGRLAAGKGESNHIAHDWLERTTKGTP